MPLIATELLWIFVKFIAWVLGIAMMAAIAAVMHVCGLTADYVRALRSGRD